MSKKSKGKNPQPPKPKCIFCGNTPLTEEHFWPDWLKTIMPKDGANSHIHRLINLDIADPSLLVVTPSMYKKPGPKGSRKLKVVCGDCNNGWMSKIENEVKPILENLILDRSIDLTTPDQLLLVRWAVSRSIIGEYTDLPTQAISPGERKYFKDTLYPPLNWFIWIAKNGSDWSQTYQHMCAKIGLRDPYTFLYKIPEKPNVQQSIIAIGNLVVCTVKLPFSNPNYFFLGSWAKKMIQIYPKTTSVVNLKNAIPLTDEDINALRYNLLDFLNAIKKPS